MHLIHLAILGFTAAQAQVALPDDVTAVWDLESAHRVTTPTRERACINGLWMWQPVETKTDEPPDANWGYHKVPGPWPGSYYYMLRDTQEFYPHPAWADDNMGDVAMAWYQRDITVPADWTDRRIALEVSYANSYVAAYIDGESAGEVYFPGGEIDLTDVVTPGETHSLSLYVAAIPLNEEIVSYAAADGASKARGKVLRRGLCGDVWLTSAPSTSHLTDVRVTTSVADGEIRAEAGLAGLPGGKTYSLQLSVDGESIMGPGGGFAPGDAANAALATAVEWMPDDLWDIHTPGNQHDLTVELIEGNTVVDTYEPIRFGFRDLVIDGRDFVLNGKRIWLFAVPLDLAQISPHAASYEGAVESMRRLKRLGINFVYTHNYDCNPGSHLGFEEILRAADDVGMLISFSQPHVKDYDWSADDADESNGYARHAEFYVRQAQNHPSVVMYSMNHNMTGYSQDMDPQRIDGTYNPYPDPTGETDERSDRNALLGRRAEGIVSRLDSSRIVYHHSSGNFGSMHTSNFYINFVPIQERSDWFEHWATEGVKPVFLCEYGIPLRMSWSMHRGWYQGKRSFTNGKIPHQFCTAEWGAQYLGDAAFDLTEPEKADLRFESEKWRAGETWMRWDYPFQLNNDPALNMPNLDDVQRQYVAENWPAYRTWGLAAFNIWSYGNKWKLKPETDKSRVDLPVDWENLQRPGFNSDYLDGRYERIDTGFEWDDWEPTETAKAFLRYNTPVLAYLAGKADRFTSQDHIFTPGETVEKQIIVINNSREPVEAECEWRLPGATPDSGQAKLAVETGQMARVPISVELSGLAPGEYELTMVVTLDTATQEDSFTIHVVSPAPEAAAKVTAWDPLGETSDALVAIGIDVETVAVDADLTDYEVLVIGKGALTVDGPAPDLTRVRDGLKVIVFEQTAEALEQRLGFRVQEYGLRRVFPRVPDHPVLAGLSETALHDWRGAATLLAPTYDEGASPSSVPKARWCGIENTRAWRAGNYGNVASVLIEKPARGDFLPIVDGGFSLQYAPLLEHREGSGMVLFCQMDVTARTESDPAAETLLTNIIGYASAPVGGVSTPTPLPAVGYTGDPRGAELLGDAVTVLSPADCGKWLDDGGTLLAVGLDQAQARAALPVDVTMQTGEHISTTFAPTGLESSLAGVGPADVLTRDPKEIPLVTGGAETIGNGVLATSFDGRVVLCQLAPGDYAYEDQFNLKMTYRRVSALVSRLAANLGAEVTTPLLDHFATPIVSATESVALNDDFSEDADGDGNADAWSFSSSAADGTWERVEEDGSWCVKMTSAQPNDKGAAGGMLAQHDVPIVEGQWCHVSIRARAEGLRGAPITFTITNTDVWKAFFEYQRFIPTEEWQDFEFTLQANGGADSKTRLQVWHDLVGTWWIAGVQVVPIAPPTDGRWLAGLYADVPSEMDDPYRFFRW